MCSTSSETATTTAASTEETNSRGNWKAGVVAGLAGSFVTGVLISRTNAVATPALYGLAPPPNPFAGWFVHASHGAVFGVGFAALAGALGYGGDATRSAGLGVVIWIVAAALVMPLWLRTAGFAGAPPFPNFAVPSLLWHAVYGVVLGALSPSLRD